jgi:HEAT repeat protein
MKMHGMIISTLLLLTSLMGLSPAMASAGQTRKTLCTATLNSSTEKQAFEEFLTPLGFDLVELTEQTLGEVKKGEEENSKKKDEWFEASCKKKIQCDILVVSGHFGGFFFGESRKTLSVEKLEENSCNRDCSGILKRPKEVFLFGCNTLAGKGKDRRTPEQYLQVLLQDGFTRAQAEATVGFRYSPIGNTFSDRMRRIFSNTPRIYGFSSIGPAGKSVNSMLRSYLSSSTEYYKTWDINSELNQNFLSKLKITTVTQATGDTNVSPICYLQSRRTSQLDKLKWIKTELDAGNYLKSLHSIKFALSKINARDWVPNREEKETLSDITNNQEAKDITLRMLQQPMGYLLSSQVDMIQIASDLNWMTTEQSEATLMRLAWGGLDKEFTNEQMDGICSLGRKIKVPFHIPEARYKDFYFIMALQCTLPPGHEVLSKIIETLKSQDNEFRRLRITFLEGITTNESFHLGIIDLMNDADEEVAKDIVHYISANKLSSENVQAALLQLLKHPNPMIRGYTVKALGEMDTSNQNIRLAMAEMLDDKDANVRGEAADALGLLKTTDTNIHRKLARQLKSARYEDRISAVRTLGLLETQDPAIQLAMAELMKAEEFNVQTEAIKALGNTRTSNENIQQTIVSFIGDTYHERPAMNALEKIKPSSAKVLAPLVTMLGDHQSIYVKRRSAVETLGKIGVRDEKIQLIIAGMLKDEEESVREEATEALALIKPTSAKVLKAIQDAQNK